MMRLAIDRKCYQYGRSGGWFSICSSKELENFEADFWMDISSGMSNAECNEYLRCNILHHSETKKDLLFNLKQQAQDWEDKKAFIQNIVEDIESSTKHFKDCLLERLTLEVGEFLEELNTDTSNVSISIVNNNVVSTMGISVPLSTFRANLKFLTPQFQQMKLGDELTIAKKVGNYFVQYARKVENDILVKAGCHRFSLNNINAVILNQS